MKQNCRQCNGSGQIKTPNGQLWQVCTRCDGTGEDPGSERWFTYVANISLLANGLLQNQRVVINGDADFRLKLLTCTKTGAFDIRLFDSSGRYFSSGGEGATNDRVQDSCLFGDGQLPYIVVPHIVIPAGGFLGFDIADLSAAPNSVHIAFHGAKIVY